MVWFTRRSTRTAPSASPASAPRVPTPPRNIRRAVEAHLTLPEVADGAHPRGAVWAVTMVKNEADVIESSIRHLFHQGVDAMLVSDNGSTDGTLDILHRLAGEFPIHLATDSLVAYEQSAKMSRLARFAHDHGAGWVVPFDADEFLFDLSGRLVADTLRAAPPHIGVMEARMFNLFPTSDIIAGTSLQSYDYRMCLKASALNKVTYRSHPQAVLAMGNHDVACPGERVTSLVVMHVPWRSRAQMGRKVGQGVAAVVQTGQPDNTCRHWKAVAGQGDDDTSYYWHCVTTGTPEAMIGLPADAGVAMANPFGVDQSWRDLLPA